jgi:predicted N-acyltransferase
VAGFLQSERADVQAEMEELAAGSPFRREGETE